MVGADLLTVGLQIGRSYEGNLGTWKSETGARDIRARPSEEGDLRNPRPRPGRALPIFLGPVTLQG